MDRHDYSPADVEWLGRTRIEGERFDEPKLFRLPTPVDRSCQHPSRYFARVS